METPQEAEHTASPHDRASDLQQHSQSWQDLIAVQQSIVTQLEAIAGSQHHVSRSLQAYGSEDLSRQALQIEAAIRELANVVLKLEARSLERLEELVAEAEVALKFASV